MLNKKNNYIMLAEKNNNLFVKHDLNCTINVGGF